MTTLTEVRQQIEKLRDKWRAERDKWRAEVVKGRALSHATAADNRRLATHLLVEASVREADANDLDALLASLPAEEEEKAAGDFGVSENIIILPREEQP